MPKKMFVGTQPRWAPSRRLAALVSVGAAMAIALSACSDADGKGADSSDPSTATSPSSGASADCVAAATKNADVGMAPMTIDQPSPIDASSIAGKKFAVIMLTGQAARNKSQAEGMQAALEAVGAETIIYDGKATPDVIAQGFQSAIGQKVSGIVTIGFDPALVKSSVADAQAASIPVVSATAVEPDAPHLPGVVANVAVNSYLEGSLQADYALVATKCKLNTVAFFTSAGPVTVHHAEGAEEEIKKLCGSDCSFEKEDVNAATFATKMAGQVQTTLQRSPDINFVLSTADVFVPYVIQGRAAVDRNDVPVAGAQGDSLADAIAGKAQVADVMWPPGEVVGWYMADAIMRAVLGEPKNQELPLRLVDSTNWGTSADFEEQFPELVGYQDTFKQAWGF